MQLFLRICFSLLCFSSMTVGVIFTVRAQPAPRNPDLLPTSFLPKSPTVSAIQRFDDQRNVDLMTGAAQLSIPLGAVTSGDLQLPVSLSYHYTGLKVYQPKDLIGLGWSLQAGGSITRRVNGLLDETVGAYGKYDSITVEQNINDQTYLHNVHEGYTDAQPDIYSFSLPGYSGQFIIKDTTVILFPKQALRVVRINKYNFKIIAETGIKYLFESRENTQPNFRNFGNNLGDYISAWHLTEIISTSNIDTIRLHYSNPGNKRYIEPKRLALTLATYQDPTNYLSSCGSSNKSFYNVFTQSSFILPQYLDSITARNTSLSIDRDPEHIVKKIRILSNHNGRNSLRYFELVHTVFAGNGGGTSDRLRLDQIQERNGVKQLPPLQFYYNNNVVMPSWLTTAQDYWGYYNGAESNRILLTDSRLLSDAANRSAQFSSCIGGALEKVVYPTGGSMQFLYEENRYQTKPYFDFRELELSVRYIEGQSSSLPQPNNNTRICAEQSSLSLSYGSTLSFLVTRQKSDDEMQGYISGATNRYQDFELYRTYLGRDSLIARRLVPPDRNPDNTIASQTWNFTLPAGVYKIRIISEQQGSTQEQHNSVFVRVPEKILKDAAGSGIRVRQTIISTYGAPDNIRTYEYVHSDASGTYSSGRVQTRYTEDDSYNYSESYELEFRLRGTCLFEKRSSDNSIFGTDHYNVPFFYERVVEKKGDDSAPYGITVSCFQSTNDLIGGHSLFNNIELKKKIIYRQNNDQHLQLAQRDNYEYFIDNIRSCRMLRTQLKEYNTKPTEGTNWYYTYDAVLEPLHSSLIVPNKVTQVRYDEKGDSLVTVTFSSYREQRLVRTVTRTSTSWQITKVKYLTDFLTSLPEVISLRRQNFNPIIETQNWQRPIGQLDSTLIGGQLTFYDARLRQPVSNWSLDLSQPVARPNAERRIDNRYASFKSDTRYRPVDSVRYDPVTGLVRERQKPSGSCTTYLWSYNRTQIVAQVENATYAQVLAVLGQATITQLLDKPNSDEQVRALLQPLRTQLPQARTSTYTHQPLVGITSQTGPDNRTIFYEYDALGRLLRVRDEQGRILSQQEYKYAKQP